MASQSRLPGATGTADARSLCGRGRAARSSGTADRPAGWFSSVVLRPQRLQRRSVAMGLLAGDLSETHWALCSAIASATTTTTTTAAVVAAAAAKQLMSSSHTMPGQRKQKQQQKKKRASPFFSLERKARSEKCPCLHVPCALCAVGVLSSHPRSRRSLGAMGLLSSARHLSTSKTSEIQRPLTHPSTTDGRAGVGRGQGGREDWGEGGLTRGSMGSS